ncbi:dirigent protein 1-like [Sesamum indicum]|uniref:Dirigent protein n=1 Tax=Sesamum indicum TaxID=4182 RepID=A0A6I9SZP1_SESIN|nr:dirigent protein 1-like [Sesamum indicum]
MGSLLTILMLIATLGSLATHADGRVIAMPGAGASTGLKLPKSFQSVQDRFSNLNIDDHFVIHFYVHETVSGENRTAWPVATSNITDPPTFFGLTQVVDHLLTFEPDEDSPAGRLQGTRTFTDLHQPALSVNLHFLNDWGPFREVISVQGRFSVFDKVRELSVVGGTGIFTMARGYALSAPYTVNLGSGIIVDEYVLIFRREG